VAEATAAAGGDASGAAAMDVDEDGSRAPMEVDSSSSSSTPAAAAAALAASAAAAAAAGSSGGAAGEQHLVALPWCGLVLLPSQVTAACSGMHQQQSSAAAAAHVTTAVKGAVDAAMEARKAQERAAEAIALARAKLAAEAAAATAGGVAEGPWDKEATTALLQQAQRAALASEQLVQQHRQTAEQQLQAAAGQLHQVRTAPRISSSALNSCIRFHDLEHTALPTAAAEQRGLRAVLVAASEAVPLAACVQPLIHQISKRAVTAAPALHAVAAAKLAATAKLSAAGSSANTIAVALTVCAFSSNGSLTKLSCNHYSATVSAAAGSAVATVVNTFKTVRAKRGKQQQQQQQKAVARITNSIAVSKYFTPETEELVGSVVLQAIAALTVQRSAAEAQQSQSCLRTTLHRPA
jgi:hypothetical protein